MSAQSSRSLIPRLSVLLPIVGIIWIVAVVWIHGFAMLAYVAFHAATTGVFAYAMLQTERSRQSEAPAATGSPLNNPAESPAAETDAGA